MATRGIRTSGYRDYVDYDKVKQDNRDRATSFHWELEFTKKPTGVYIPPDTIMKIRFDEVTPPKTKQAEPLETELKGWKFYQPALNDYSGDLNAKGIDFIDQSMEYAFREMVYETDRPLDHTQKPKEEMLWDAILTQCNNQDVPIRQYVMTDCLLSEFDPTNSYTGKKDLNGEITCSWKVSMCTEVQLNTKGLV